jgi:hypothetical protein
VALAEYCRRQLTPRRRGLGLLAAVIILAAGWIAVRFRRPGRGVRHSRVVGTLIGDGCEGSEHGN